MKLPVRTLDLARAYLAAQTAGFDIQAFAAGHTRQLEVLTAARVEPRILLMMARQTGKSWSLFGSHADRAVSRPGSTNLFFGLTGPAVRNVFWEPIWKPLCARYRLPVRNLDTTMTALWDNGSRTLFSGTDDVRHIQNVLGGRLDGSLVTVDEMQSQPGAVAKALLRTILPPMLTPSSTLMLAGTLPEAPGGVWWEESQRSSYWQRSWGRMDNVHTPEARAVLDKHLLDNGLTEQDPQIQRDWFGNRTAFDPNARAYFYRQDINGYSPIRPAWLDALHVKSGEAFGATPWPGVDAFSAALDPGSADPCGITILGWGRGVARVQHVFDWVSTYNARLSLDDMVDVVRHVRDALGPGRAWQYRYDTNSQQEINAFAHSHGIGSIKAAAKADFPGQLRRTNNLLSNGTLAVIEGSNLATDFVSARLTDPNQPSKGWSNDYHPTASECARYALAGYWEEQKPAVVPPKPIDPFEAEVRARAAAALVPDYLRRRQGR